VVTDLLKHVIRVTQRKVIHPALQCEQLNSWWNVCT
jgi:hypothetical protein